MSLLLSLLLDLLFNQILVSISYLLRYDLSFLLHTSATGVGSLAIGVWTRLLAGLVGLSHGVVLFLCIFILLLLILFILLVTDIRSLSMGILILNEIGCLTLVLGRLWIASSLYIGALDTQLPWINNSHWVPGGTLSWHMGSIVIASSWLSLGLDLKFGFLRALRTTLMLLFLEGFTICTILLGDVGTAIGLVGEAHVIWVVSHSIWLV